MICFNIFANSDMERVERSDHLSFNPSPGDIAMDLEPGTITEILSVGPQKSAPGTGAVQIRYRSGRRAEEVCILHDAAVALVVELEAYWRKPAGLRAFLLPAGTPDRALT
jgi:hypothetical protein